MTQNTSRYAPTAWGGSPYTDLECPSGQLCLVRKLQPADLTSANLLGSTDLLGSIVQEKIATAKKTPQDRRKPKAQAQKELAVEITDQAIQALSEPGNLESMIDSVVVRAVVEPAILLPPDDFADRTEGTVYADTVSFSDKMFIFNWVMSGVDSLKAFRGQADGDVADLEAGEGVRKSPE